MVAQDGYAGEKVLCLRDAFFELIVTVKLTCLVRNCCEKSIN